MAIGKSIVRLGFGSGLAQVGQLLFVPILGRSFSPAAYGVYVLFVGFMAVGAVFAGLRYDSAVVLPKRNSLANALGALVLVLSVTFAAILLVGTGVAAWVLDGPQRGDWIVFGLGLVSISPLQALQRLYSAWLARSGKFGVSGTLQFCIVMGTILIQLGLHFSGQKDVVALIFGAVIALALTLALFSGFVRSELRQTIAFASQTKRMGLVAHRYQRFPRYTILYGLSSTLRERLIHMEFGGIAGLQALGRFAMSVRLVGSPNTLLYAGIGPVFYAHASRVTKDEVAHDGAAILELILAALAPIYVVVALNAEPLITLALGTSWDGTGAYVAILCLPYLAQTVTSWFDRVFDVFNNQKQALILDAIFTCTLVVSVGSALYLRGGIAGAICYALVSCVYCLAWMPIAYIANGLAVRLLIRPAVVAISLVCGWVIVAMTLQRYMSLLPQLAVDAALYLIMLAVYVYTFGGARKIGMLFR